LAPYIGFLRKKIGEFIQGKKNSEKKRKSFEKNSEKKNSKRKKMKN
jgi:hypothetical protein